MHSNTDGMNLINQGVGVDFKYFIQSAIQKEIPWKSLAFFITNLIMSLDQSKEVIRILVDELEIWVLKVQNESGNDIIEVTEILPEIEEQDEDQGSDVNDFKKHLETSASEEAQKDFLVANDDDSDDFTKTKFTNNTNAENSEDVSQILEQFYTYVDGLNNEEKEKINSALS